MSKRFDIEIDGVKYHGETGSAKGQWEAIQICTQTQLLGYIKDGKTDAAIVIAVNSIPQDKVDRLIKLIVERRVFRTSDNVEVAINLFDDDIANWSLLIGKVLQENLRPFWKLNGLEEEAKAQ